MKKIRETTESLIDFLYELPEPKKEEVRRWEKARKLILFLLIPYMLSLIYVAYLSRSTSPSGLWKSVVDWIFANIPSSQGFTYRSVTTADIWPEIYAIYFIFGAIVFIISATLSTNGPAKRKKGYKPTPKQFITAYFFFAILYAYIIWILIFWGETGPIDRGSNSMGPRGGYLEYRSSIVFITSFGFYYAAYFLGTTAAVIRMIIRKSIYRGND